MHDMELAQGVILDGHYKLRQLLGRGGMGEVWEAEHTRLPKRFAIKFLLGLSKAEAELSMRFRREAEIASRLSHPSIVQVTDFNTLPDGTAYLVMERLEGEDLRARLERGPLTLDEAREITRQVASALELAHREGIVHRDLKPENIFLCREPDGALRAKVLDFGISKLQSAAGQGTRDDRVLGTPGYMAPEQALGKNSSIDSRTDLFSLATIVYEMLTGKSVFVGDTLAELCTKVLYHTPPPLDEVLPSVPRSLAAAVATALAKDPAARQPEIRSFAQAIAGTAPAAPEALGSAPTLAHDSSSAVTRSRRPAGVAASDLPGPKPKRALAAWAAALVTLILGAAAWIVVRGERSADPLAATVGAGPSREAALAPPTRANVTPEPEPEHQPAAPTEPPADTRPPPDAGGAGTSKRASTQERRASTQERARLAPGLESALDDAERALDRGDVSNALRLARNTLREANSERAYFVMARAYCAQHDLGMVKAMLRNLSPPARAQVRENCKAKGLTLP